MNMEPKMSFGDAIEAMRSGKRVARSGWNGKGMFLFLIDHWTWMYIDGKLNDYPNLPFIAMKTATGEVVPWLASQTDMLGLDWELVSK